MSDEKKKYEPYYEISQREIHINIIISALFLFIGVILLAFGLNGAFFVSEGILYDIFNIITEFGGEEIYILFYCIFLFGIDKRFAKRLLIGLVISLHLTDFFKSLFMDPRPDSNFIADSVGKEEGYGFPSGHASGAMSFYGFTFFSFKGEEKKKRIPWRIFTMFLMIMIPISRLIIGVHDLQDVIGGLMLGLLVITAYMYFEPKLSSIVGKWSMKKKILIGVSFSLGLWIFSSLLLYLLVINNPDWPGIQENIIYLALSCGLFLGMAIAYPIEEEKVKYDPKKLSVLNRILAIVIGLVINFGVLFLLGLLFDLSPGIYFITRGFKYCLFILTSSLGVPLLLKKIFKI